MEISPMLAMDQWLHTRTEEKIYPPTMKRPVGRPRKVRIKAYDESKTKHKCPRCGKLGHYEKRCKNPAPQDSDQYQASTSKRYHIANSPLVETKSVHHALLLTLEQDLTQRNQYTFSENSVDSERLLWFHVDNRPTHGVESRTHPDKDVFQGQNLITEGNVKRLLWDVWSSKGVIADTEVRGGSMVPDSDMVQSCRIVSANRTVFLLKWAYFGIHRPADFNEADLAHERIIFDEFLYLQEDYDTEDYDEAQDDV
ncbi:putative transcription factor interactor and regulator CCHC(Zn) family protein [Tanacetum coccineum]